MTSIRAWAAPAAKQKLERHDYDPGPLGDEEVEVAVEYCGMCHSDLSMIDVKVNGVNDVRPHNPCP